MASVRKKLNGTTSYSMENDTDFSPRNEEEPIIRSPDGNPERDVLFGNGDSCDGEFQRSSSYVSARTRYRDRFSQNGGCENRTGEDLDQYAIYKSEETTATVNNCLKVAEDIGQDAAKILVDLHQQGEQIRRSHNVALNIDHDLSAGEKLLGSLGGIFARTWRPKKTRPINGPAATIQDDSIQNSGNHLQQRQTIGLVKSLKSRVHRHVYPSGGKTMQDHIEIEKSKQDDALSDLSNMLDKLKDMAVDMGQEIGRQNEALGDFGDDVTELGFRVKGANARGRRLLGK